MMRDFLYDFSTGDITLEEGAATQPLPPSHHPSWSTIEIQVREAETEEWQTLRMWNSTAGGRPVSMNSYSYVRMIVTGVDIYMVNTLITCVTGTVGNIQVQHLSLYEIANITGLQHQLSKDKTQAIVECNSPSIRSNILWLGNSADEDPTTRLAPPEKLVQQLLLADGDAFVEHNNQRELDCQNLALLIALRPANILAPTLGFGRMDWLSNTHLAELQLFVDDITRMAENDGCKNPEIDIVTEENNIVIKFPNGTYL